MLRRDLLLWTVVVILPAAEAAEWSDGTPIVRFDKRDDCPMAQVVDWSGIGTRPWPGPSIWANRLQDWSVVADDLFDGALECAAVRNLPCRTAHLLTHELGGRPQPFRLEGLLRLSGGAVAGFAGFLVGAGEGRLDYRGAALVQYLPGKGGGLLAVVETSEEGGLAFRDMSQPETGRGYPLLEGQRTVVREPIRLTYHQMMLNLEGLPREGDVYDLRLSVWARHSGELLGAQELAGVPAVRLRGNVGLVSHGAGQATRHRFGGLKVGGGRFEGHPERAFGPCAGTLYTVSGRTLKLSAQFMDLGEALLPRGAGRSRGRPRMRAHLEARPLGTDGEWRQVARPQALGPPDYYVRFRVDGWDSNRDWETRVVFPDERGETHYYRTIVRHDPVEKPVLSLAAFTGMGVMGRLAGSPGPEPGEGEAVVGRWTPANVWMPFTEAVSAVRQQDVDILFFTGDQIYEGKPTPPEGGREPFRDYLYKWLLWHWSFRELTNHLPALCQPDDHDVYHGNLWGWGGRINLTGFNGGGGYLCSPDFVNMVHRTQTGHHPDAYDPIPLPSGITNYYGGFTYGGIGFAVLEDRKFKCPSRVQDPEQQTQLGAKQLQFLKEWGEDWTGQKFKVVVSQTIYAAMHVSFDGKMSRDTDTNGWPKVGRDRAVRMFRRFGAFVISGDQHLGTFARLGIEQPSDAVYQLCVPALANIFWRWFYPNQPGQARADGEPAYLGEFTDAWGNYFRMLAVANPERKELLSQKLRQRSLIPATEARTGLGDSVRTCRGDGYGVVRLDKVGQTLTLANWPHNADPGTGGKPFPGWPVTLKLEDLDGRKPVAWLPDLEIQSRRDAVVQIVEQDSGEVVKVTRARDGTYRPGVFDATKLYLLRVGEPGVTSWWVRRDLKPAAKPGEETLRVTF